MREVSKGDIIAFVISAAGVLGGVERTAARRSRRSRRSPAAQVEGGKGLARVEVIDVEVVEPVEVIPPKRGR
jgi:hypothetical protein